MRSSLCRQSSWSFLQNLCDICTTSAEHQAKRRRCSKQDAESWQPLAIWTAVGCGWQGRFQAGRGPGKVPEARQRWSFPHKGIEMKSFQIKGTVHFHPFSYSCRTTDSKLPEFLGCLTSLLNLCRKLHKAYQKPVAQTEDWLSYLSKRLVTHLFWNSFLAPHLCRVERCCNCQPLMTGDKLVMSMLFNHVFPIAFWDEHITHDEDVEEKNAPPILKPVFRLTWKCTCTAPFWFPKYLASSAFLGFRPKWSGFPGCQRHGTPRPVRCTAWGKLQMPVELRRSELKRQKGESSGWKGWKGWKGCG